MKSIVKGYGQKTKASNSKVSLGNLPMLKMNDATANSPKRLRAAPVRELSFPDLNYWEQTGKNTYINGTHLKDHLISLECRKSFKL